MKTLSQLFPLPAPEFTFAGFAWPRRVAMLPRGTVAARIERHTKPATGPYYHAPKPASRGNGLAFYLASDFAPGLRWQWADDVCRSISHTGWFTDEFGDSETIRGIVCRLPKSRGFLAGWSMGEGMASELDATVYDDEEDAARAADSMAESAAEHQREYEAEERERLECEEEAA